MEKTDKVLLENIRLPYRPGESQDAAALDKASAEIRRVLGIHPQNLHINKKSIDARRRDHISFVYSVYAEVQLHEKDRVRLEHSGMKLYTPAVLPVGKGTEKLTARPVIIGFGPAGMFCGMLLSEMGLRPLILERGSSVADRTEKVKHFLRTGQLDHSSNIQFGAGGAGTFSDGKLTTRIHDPMVAAVIEKLLTLGAPADIAWRAKPHIGTDILVRVVENADACIRAYGGEILYDHPVTHIGKDFLTVQGEKIPYGVLILAAGHSARDLYADLMQSDYAIVPKPFSVGVRIEHPQSWLNETMFGSFAGDVTLGQAEYQLSHREGERGCYTFCMCPGGEVMAAASEAGGVVTNGMSRYARDGRNANAAICVSVHPMDYGNTPAGAIAFQRMLEKKAYEAGGRNFYAPMQTVGDFLEHKSGTSPTVVEPTYRGGLVTPTDLRPLFPAFVNTMLENGLRRFDRQLPGYAAAHIPMTGVETRTSAPVRILRMEDCTAVNHSNVYPCGEGAGYAGGIVSAAVDGLRVALAILRRYDR